MSLPLAETINYWRSSRGPADAWIAKAIELLTKFGATDISEGFGARNGAAGFLLYFQLNGEGYRLAWPVLPTKFAVDAPAARIQAATLLYHDVKNKALIAAVLGTRTAFIGNLLLPNGMSVGEATSVELQSTVKLLEVK